MNRFLPTQEWQCEQSLFVLLFICAILFYSNLNCCSMKIFNTTKEHFTDWLQKQTSTHSFVFILLLAIYFGYILYHHLCFTGYMSYLDNLDFFIHELGHPIFSLSGNQFVGILWWTLMQLIIPFLCLSWFYVQKDRFAVLFTYAWIGTNFFYISFYSADAQRMQLPLFWMWKGDHIHDWNYLFSHLWILSHTDTIAFSFKLIALWFFVVFFVNTFFLLLNKLTFYKRVQKTL